ncbi:MAG: hypothetical protein ACREDG_05610, partial [Methylocella sp.]
PWRSLKHADVYIKGYADGLEARLGIATWIKFSNDRRLHQARYRAPMALWRAQIAGAGAVDMIDTASALPHGHNKNSRHRLWLHDKTQPLAA